MRTGTQSGTLLRGPQEPKEACRLRLQRALDPALIFCSAALRFLNTVSSPGDEIPITRGMRPARLDHSFFDDEPRSHLGALLLRKGLVTHDDLDRALEEREPGELLGEALVRLQICFEADIARVLAEQASTDFIDIGVTSVDPRAVKLLPRRLAEELRAIPVRTHSDGTVWVAVADPTDDTLVAELRLALGHPVRLLVTTPSALRQAWKQAY